MNNNNPFALASISNKYLRRIVKVISKTNVLERWYDEWLDKIESNDQMPIDADAFSSYTLGKLGVKSKVVNEEVLASVPKEGSYIFVANHPLGGIEGIMLTQLLLKVRPDLKVLTNEMLSSIPEYSDVFIGVDVLNQNQAQKNAKGMREVARHISKGGALLVFPAGTVSRINLPSLKISDAPWNEMISRLALKYEAPIMPIFVEGKNNLSFYLSAYIHKRLRTLLLPRAMQSKSGEVISLHIGASIPASDIRRLKDDDRVMHYIRLCCKVMSSPNELTTSEQNENKDQIKPDLQKPELSSHIDTLGEFHLCSSREFRLYCVPFERLGPVMYQLSIERERTFRAVDEGTGKELDTDKFDPNYMHLFLWDEAKQKIGGGYRLGKTDELLNAHKLEGLYSHSLFDYDENFLRNMGKSIEVGRSFVTKDYQKNPAALDTLFRGIGQYVAKNPEYHTLFGCVSISRQYSGLAAAMLTETFLSHYGVDSSLSRKVKARVPFKKMKGPWSTEQLASLSEIPIINKLVGRIDPGKSVPTLIRHYLSLDGRFVSFTVNTSFNNSLDGLIVVDLRNTSSKYLKRYMGPEGMAQFVEYHNVAIAKTAE